MDHKIIYMCFFTLEPFRIPETISYSGKIRGSTSSVRVQCTHYQALPYTALRAPSLTTSTPCELCEGVGVWVWVFSPCACVITGKILSSYKVLLAYLQLYKMARITAPELEQFIVATVELTGRVLGAGAYGSVEEVEIPGAKVAAKKLHQQQLVNLGSPQQVDLFLAPLFVSIDYIYWLIFPHRLKNG